MHSSPLPAGPDRATVIAMPRSPDPKSLRPLSAPCGLRAVRAVIGGEEVAILSFPLRPPTLPCSLSAAEREIAVALLDGQSNAEIAAARGTSARTVANQVASIFHKLGVRSRCEAVSALARLQES